MSSSSEYIFSTVSIDHRLDGGLGRPVHRRSRPAAIGMSVVRYLEKMSAAASSFGRSILIFTSRRPGRRIAGSIRSSRFEAPTTITFFKRLDTVDLGQQLRNDRRLDVARDARATRAEQRVHLVEEHDDRNAFLGLLLRALEDHADLALGLADVLVEELGAFDVQEVGAAFVAAQLRGDLLGERVRDRLRDERLAATRRPVEQDALRRLELVLAGTGRRAGTAARRRRGSPRSGRPRPPMSS